MKWYSSEENCDQTNPAQERSQSLLFLHRQHTHCKSLAYTPRLSIWRNCVSFTSFEEIGIFTTLLTHVHTLTSKPLTFFWVCIYWSKAFLSKMFTRDTWKWFKLDQPGGWSKRRECVVLARLTWDYEFSVSFAGTVRVDRHARVVWSWNFIIMASKQFRMS